MVLSPQINNLRQIIFKSMLGGSGNTRNRRLGQVSAVGQIVTDRFGANHPGNHPFIVLGDFNDYIEAGHEAPNKLCFHRQ